MSDIRNFNSLANYIDSAPGNSRTCIGCNMWEGSDRVFSCPKGGIVHRAQVMRCHSGNKTKREDGCCES